MVTLTPTQRKQVAKMLVILEDMLERNAKMIEIVDRVNEQRKSKMLELLNM